MLGGELPRTLAYAKFVNKGMKKDRSLQMPRSSRFSFARRLLPPRLVDEVESADVLICTRFQDYLAPHAGVLARAAADGI